MNTSKLCGGLTVNAAASLFLCVLFSSLQKNNILKITVSDTAALNRFVVILTFVECVVFSFWCLGIIFFPCCLTRDMSQKCAALTYLASLTAVVAGLLVMNLIYVQFKDITDRIVVDSLCGGVLCIAAGINITVFRIA